MDSDQIDPRTSDAINMVKARLETGRIGILTDSDSHEFLAAAAAFIMRVGEILPNIDESARYALASWIHPEGTVEHRGVSKSPITGLPDKEPFLELLPTFEANPNYAVVSMDANYLKPINDQLGHHYGDAMLLAIARSLVFVSQSMGERSINIFHLSGDEFAAFVPVNQVQEFIEAVVSHLDETLQNDKIENGRRDANLRHALVPTEGIRRILGDLAGIRAGYGPTEDSAEAMLKLNKQTTAR
jgi:diguanylate cyclase (GGDEF)-like protein